MFCYVIFCYVMFWYGFVLLCYVSCYVYVLLCLCFVMCMFVMLMFVMFLFCYAYLDAICKLHSTTSESTCSRMLLDTLSRMLADSIFFIPFVTAGKE